MRLFDRAAGHVSLTRQAHHCFGTPARYPRFVSEAQGELAAGEGQLSESLNVGVSPSGFDHAPRARTMLAQEQS